MDAETTPRTGLKILLIDDHRLIVELVSTYLETNRGMTVRSAPDLTTGLTVMAGEGPFDAILLDLVLPDMHRVSDVRKVVDAALDTPVVIFSGNASDEKVSDALSQGAKGFIPKVVSLRALSTAIELVAAGESFVPTDFARKAAPSRGAAPGILTALELDVLHAIARGQTNKLIAYEHDLSESTTKMHVRRICQKLEAQNRAHAVVRGKELGLI